MEIKQHILNEIKDQYHYVDDGCKPWVIGFSGGKDSTMLLLLVWEAVAALKRESKELKREIHVVSNDTLVENPVIHKYQYEIIDKIKKAAIEQDLPISVHITKPKLEDSFWLQLIGKGYPSPTQSFRWCTTRLKIKPTSAYILDREELIKGCIVLLGTRMDEGAARFEIRKHDRTYKPGDLLHLREFEPEMNVYTGREYWVKIKYLLRGGQFGLEKGYCALAIDHID